MLNKTVTIITTLMISTATSAYWQDRNNNNQGKMPVDVPNSSMAYQGGDVIIKTEITTPRPYTQLCDFLAVVDAVRGQNVLTQKDYVQDLRLQAYRTFTHRWVFAESDLPPGYQYVQSSMAVPASCLEIGDNTPASDVPMPNTICDPEKDPNMCGNTCNGRINGSGSNCIDRSPSGWQNTRPQGI